VIGKKYKKWKEGHKGRGTGKEGGSNCLNVIKRGRGMMMAQTNKKDGIII
jgi:hypothetical protein